jgi:hypothetical protein
VIATADGFRPRKRVGTTHACCAVRQAAQSTKGDDIKGAVVATQRLSLLPAWSRQRKNLSGERNVATLATPLTPLLAAQNSA